MGNRIGLSLSGGGVRAAAFHLGVLKRLADEDLLERVAEISTVSGGSLAIAAVFSGDLKIWPASKTYREVTFPHLKSVLTRADLFSLRAIGLAGLLRHNLKLVNRRANVLSSLLQTAWGVSGTLADLPDSPRWSINATCIETGKNWRFSKRMMGDWVFGRHFAPAVPIADAAAASAAVPYVIGAMHLSLPSDGWYETNPATKEPTRRISTASSVRLWDGGVYENLGLELLFKPERGLIDCDFLICSDASAELQPETSSTVSKLLRGHLPSPRLFDIGSDQIRMLRSRMLMRAILAGDVQAVILRMGNSIRDIDIGSRTTRLASEYDRFQTDQEVATAFKYPTDLAALSERSFDVIARHGYEVTNCTLRTYKSKHFEVDHYWT